MFLVVQGRAFLKKNYKAYTNVNNSVSFEQGIYALLLKNVGLSITSSKIYIVCFVTQRLFYFIC